MTHTTIDLDDPTTPDVAGKPHRVAPPRRPPAGSCVARGHRRVRLVRRPPRARRRRPAHARGRGHRAHRPSGCGKSTFLRLLNRMHELVPGAALAGEIRLDGEDIYAPGTRAQQIRMRIGMVFQKPNPFPAMNIRDNVLSGLKLARIGCHDKDGLVEQSLEPGRALARGARPPRPARRRALRRPAAAPVHRPGARGAAQRAAHGRALLRARPHLHPPHRGDHRRAAPRGDRGDRHPQHAAGAARCRTTARSSSPRRTSPATWSSTAATSKLFSSPDDPRTHDYVEGRFG